MADATTSARIVPDNASMSVLPNALEGRARLYSRCMGQGTSETVVKWQQNAVAALFCRLKRKAAAQRQRLLGVKSLAVTYSHMGVRSDRLSSGQTQRDERREPASGRSLSEAKSPTEKPFVGSPHAQKSRFALTKRLFQIKSLAVTYSHMGRPHTTIGAERFHF